MVAWAKEHPILAAVSGLLIIVLLYLLLRGGSSSSSTQAVSSGPSDALQTAGMAAQVQSQQVSASLQAHQGDVAAALAAAVSQAGVQNNQTQAARDVALQQTLTGGSVAEYNAATQLQGLQSTNSAGVQIAGINAGAAVDLARINTGAAVQVAGIQADVSKNTTAAQLQLGLDTNKTSLGIAGLSLEGLKTTTAATLAATESTNQTAAQIAAGHEQTLQVAIGTQGAVEQNQINQQGQVVADQYSLAQQHESNVYGPGGIFVGVNRYGGNLQSNQSTVEAAILNQPSVGVAIQQSSASQAQSSASMWSSIVNGIVGGATKVATAGVA